MTFTALRESAAESRISRDLDLIVKRVLDLAEQDELRAVYLLGGYARGEGAAVQQEDGSWRGFNDYDLLLVFGAEPKSRVPFQELAVTLAREIEIDFVDLGIATVKDLAAAQPTLFWVELSMAHRLLWSSSETGVALPEFSVEHLLPEEAAHLIVNRGMALLWALVRTWSDRPGESELTQDDCELHFAAIAGHKAVLAGGDGILIASQKYALSAHQRLGLIQEDELLPPEFRKAYAAGVAFRRAPAWPAPHDVAALVEAARGYHEFAFSHVEKALGLPTAWPDHRRTLQRIKRSTYLLKPRTVLKALAGRSSGVDPNRFRAELPGLLYDAQGRPPWHRNPSWREQALDLVKEWHP